MSQQNTIEALIAPSLRGLGFRLVRAHLGGDKRQTLQILVEQQASADAGEAGDGGITVTDCAKISRTVAAILDVHDPVKGAYDLEVSSPGMDRPLIDANDFQRFRGFDAKIETSELVEARKRFRGTLVAADDTNVDINIGGDGGIITVPLKHIIKAHLLITDALVAATLKARANSNSKANAKPKQDA